MWAHWLVCKMNFIWWVTVKNVWNPLGWGQGINRSQKGLVSPQLFLLLPGSCWFIILPGLYLLPSQDPHPFSSHSSAQYQVFQNGFHTSSLPDQEGNSRKKLFWFFSPDTPHSSNLSGVRIERHTWAFLNPRTKTTALIPPILRAGSFPDHLRLSEGGIYSFTFEPHEFSHQ